MPPLTGRPLPRVSVIPSLALALTAACSDSVARIGSPQTNVGVAATVTVQPNPVSLVVSDSVQLSATVRDVNGAVLANAPVSWSVGNAQTASVSGAGLLQARAAGTTVVTATSTPASGQAAVTVTAPQNGPPFRADLVTYLGGTLSDMPRDVTVDAGGNVLVVGNTESLNFPTTPGVISNSRQSGFDPPSDAFLTSISPAGAVRWSTYLGGPNYERAYAVEVDAQGFVYVGGRAGAGFPVTAGAFQTQFAGGSTSNFYGPQDAFVCKLRPDGTARVWCSYFGVGDDGIARDLDIDAQGNVYLVAWTQNGGFPAAWFTNAFKPTKSAGLDIVVAKVKADGSQVLWATYLGGAGDDAGTPAIRVDKDGNVLVLFQTTSAGLPTPNGADNSLSGVNDQFLAKLSADGSQLLYGTYVGGNGTEASETHGLAVDPQGNGIVAVATTSTDLPTLAGAAQRQNAGGGSDVGVWKVSPTGKFLAVTYFGGGGSDAVQGVATDPSSNVFLSVTTDSPTIPLTVAGGAGGGDDVVAVKLSSDLSQRVYAQRFGGSANDIARASWVGPQGQFVLVGQTTSTNFPVFRAPFATAPGGSLDGFLIRVVP